MKYLPLLLISTPAFASWNEAQEPIAGSYQKTCRNIRQAEWLLEADCLDNAGKYQYSAMPYPQYCIGDIINNAGKLTCSIYFMQFDCLKDISEVDIPPPVNVEFTQCAGTENGIDYAGNLHVDPPFRYDGKAFGKVLFDASCDVTKIELWLSPPNNFIKREILRQASPHVKTEAKKWCLDFVLKVP